MKSVFQFLIDNDFFSHIRGVKAKFRRKLAERAFHVLVSIMSILKTTLTWSAEIVH